MEQLIYILNKTIHDDGPDALEMAVNMLQGAGEPWAGEMGVGNSVASGADW